MLTKILSFDWAVHVFQRPLRSVIDLTEDDFVKIANYEPGYEWIPQHFGPPPGVHKSIKMRLGYKCNRS